MRGKKMTSGDALVIDLNDDVLIKEQTFKKKGTCENCQKKGAYYWVDGTLDIGFCYEHLIEAYPVVILDTEDDTKDGYFFPKRC